VDAPDPDISILETTVVLLHEDPIARDVTPPTTQTIMTRPAQMANVLTLRHAGGFTLVYYMLHFYFIHLYAMLLHLNPVGRRRQA
jgi:hypothetical protein